MLNFSQFLFVKLSARNFQINLFICYAKIANEFTSYKHCKAKD